MIKLCIFDLDGTLINSLPAISHFGNKALSAFGFKTHAAGKYRRFVGDGAAVLVHRMLGENDNPENFAKVKAEYDRLYENDVLYDTFPYDGTERLLGFLRENSVKSAVLSNKPHAVTSEIAARLFGGMFDEVLGQRDNVPKKPAPDGVFEICEKLGAAADETLFIGDTNVDIKTGKSAGTYTAGVLWGFRERGELEAAGADFIAASPEEIAETVRRLSAGGGHARR